MFEPKIGDKFNLNTIEGIEIDQMVECVKSKDSELCYECALSRECKADVSCTQYTREDNTPIILKPIE